MSASAARIQWGTGPFDDDTAMHLVDHLVSCSANEARVELEAAVRRVSEAGRFLEYGDAVRAVAAVASRPAATETVTPEATVTVTAETTVTVTAPAPRTGPHFGTCREANAAGYGPYRSGVDPEYDWYTDRDHDGVVCET
jgi:hypothetical protein